MNGTTKKIISALSACIILMFLAAALNRTGSLILFWKEEPLSRITHDEKYGYYADNFEEDDEEEGGYRRFRG